ncbi:YCII-related protein [Paenibacillus curdlanolyticus YK9]|uniref:YCII-related protein n=1 Tax=Paenibacillus curdlanolyticus YK9 TaxID=717606 RepID=E0IA52_9BACL|nr:YciI family protein [Paenibacillus curdlanolyticus]EFM10629.1 YCII-related protein [Paenibacillus curdlanolyticus YK9]
MYIVLVNYIKPLDEVDVYLEEHIAFLEKHYAENRFIVSGRRDPRTGGVIIAQVEDEDTIRSIMHEDPFYTNHVAEFEFIKFSPVKYAEAFSPFIV